jgi:hypothetical protein
MHVDAVRAAVDLGSSNLHHVQKRSLEPAFINRLPETQHCLACLRRQILANIHSWCHQQLSLVSAPKTNESNDCERSSAALRARKLVGVDYGAHGVDRLASLGDDLFFDAHAEPGLSVHLDELHPGTYASWTKSSASAREPSIR